MINNDKIFSCEKYTIEEKLKRLAERQYDPETGTTGDSELDKFIDYNQSQEGVGLVIGGLVLGPYLLIALLIFLSKIGEKISAKKDKKKMEKYYETNKNEINKIANQFKNIDLLSELKKIDLMFRKNPLFIESEYGELRIDEQDYNMTEISLFSINEKFIEYLINNYMFIDDENIINFKFSCSIVPKNVKLQDLINMSDENDKPCSSYSENYLKKINDEIDKLCKNSKIRYFEYKSCKVSTNPDDWYEEFDNGLPIDVELQYKLDLDKIVKG